jgi:SnoaL-like domain
MKATSSELLMRNFNEIFIELDPLKRAALLAEFYTEDCLWIHPGGRIVGREGINEAATKICKHFPEYRYTVTGEIQIMHNVATCQWGQCVTPFPARISIAHEGQLRHFRPCSGQ